MRASVGLACLLAGLLGSPGATAQQVTCRLDPARRIAETSRSSLRTWADVRRSYQSFVVDRACDDGVMAEGYSNVVVGLLANRWTQLPELERLSREDASFGAFVLQHLDATADEEELAAVAEHAATACPPEHSALCQMIEDHSRAALRAAREAP